MAQSCSSYREITNKEYKVFKQIVNLNKIKWLLVLSLLQANSVLAKSNVAVEQADTILAVFAHPDDEMTIAPLLAKYAREGKKVHLAIVTDGQNGVTPHAKIPAGDKLIQKRIQEANCSVKSLGAEPVILMGYLDGHLAEHALFTKLNQDIRNLFNQVKPDIVITMGPSGATGHIDHRMVSNVTTEVFQKGGKDWPEQLYYVAIPQSHIDAFPTINTPYGQYIKHYLHTVKDEYLPVRVQYTEEDLTRAHAANACHQSQFTKEMIDLYPTVINAKGEKTTYLRTWN